MPQYDDEPLEESFGEEGHEEGNEEEEDEETPIVGVGMWMSGPGSDEVFAAIEDECERCGLEAMRVDRLVGSAEIPAKFKRILREATIMVFDLTGVCPDVMHEIGQAERHVSKDWTILTALEGTDLPMYVQNRSVLFYKTTEQLRARLRAALSTLVEVLEQEEDRDDDDDDQ